VTAAQRNRSAVVRLRTGGSTARIAGRSSSTITATPVSVAPHPATSARLDPVVDDHGALAGQEQVAPGGEPAPDAAVVRVRDLPHDVAGQERAVLAHGREADLERHRDRGSEREAARLDAEDDVGPVVAHQLREGGDHGRERRGVAQHRPGVGVAVDPSEALAHVPSAPLDDRVVAHPATVSATTRGAEAFSVRPTRSRSSKMFFA
jgi:hypothetical protein